MSFFFQFSIVFLVFSGVFAQPTHEECREELKRAVDCAKIVSPSIYEFTDEKTFQENKKTVEQSRKCTGELQCDVTKSIVKMDSAKLEFVEKLSKINWCTGNNVYSKVKQQCAKSTKAAKQSCSSYSEFVTCIEENLAKQPSCTQEDVEKFKTFSNLIIEICNLKMDHIKAFSDFKKADFIQ
ncbi:DUF19 domain-containing protein [Caenorhabditis elegans]|uniref:DUF19 domain-containing protein n=1 Tax=Caenorhabditis elegans TaxID=6239 RepID=Q7YTI7_CAEEL|nr:DUF19 domain-containing protein [Caenorhabditis elegans]CAE18023.1 DUF19 domain-containing protein [Caenorhabditis elegans]|eukprot:NP_001023524.1 Uncharacterized protein CELE_Y57G11C.40 [Caenorhabditis elegans]